ncbi:MAG: OsmC family protein [Candidatus Dadabacteria bacterium]|nr:OsmC family protein [Candidatus Dadabacteria bacterium]
MKVEATWQKNYQVTVNARQFQIPVDESPEFSGDDTGMMPTELFLCSLASCFCLAVVYVARRKKIALKDLKVDVVGEKNGRKFLFSNCIISVKSSINQSSLEDLVDSAKHYCFITNTIKEGCPVEYRVNSDLESV